MSDWLWNTSPEFSIVTSAQSADALFRQVASGLAEAPVSLWLFLTRPFINMFHGDLTPVGFLYFALCGVWELLVWGLFGGAIARIAALKFTRDEAPDLPGALKHALSKLTSYSMAPLLALAGAAVFGIQLAILGWIMRLDFLAMVAGFAWPFTLLLGLLMAILLIGALAGWPLMWATVAVEGTDAFDALSRSYAYTYQRPLRLLWYVLLAAILAAVSMFIVKLFATSAISLGNWSVSWGLDQETYRQIVAPLPGDAAAVPDHRFRRRAVTRYGRGAGPGWCCHAQRTHGLPLDRRSGDSLLEVAAGSTRGRISGRLLVRRGGRRLFALAQGHRRRRDGRGLRRGRAGVRHAAARGRSCHGRAGGPDGLRFAGEHDDRLVGGFRCGGGVVRDDRIGMRHELTTTEHLVAAGRFRCLEHGFVHVRSVSHDRRRRFSTDFEIRSTSAARSNAGSRQIDQHQRHRLLGAAVDGVVDVSDHAKLNARQSRRAFDARGTHQIAGDEHHGHETRLDGPFAAVAVADLNRLFHRHARRSCRRRCGLRRSCGRRLPGTRPCGRENRRSRRSRAPTFRSRFVLYSWPR